MAGGRHRRLRRLYPASSCQPDQADVAPPRVAATQRGAPRPAAVIRPRGPGRAPPAPLGRPPQPGAEATGRRRPPLLRGASRRGRRACDGDQRRHDQVAPFPRAGSPAGASGRTSMNHEPFDEHLSRELRSLVADADPPPTLRPGVASARRLPRPLIVGGSIAAAVIAIVALLVSPGSGSHRQRVASEGGTTTTENGTLVPVPGVQSTALPSPASTTTTTPRRASTTLPVIAGKPTTTTAPRPRPLAATHYSLGSGMTQYWGITEGPDGNMWAVSWGDIARITPGGQVTKFAIRPVPYQGAPAGTTAGPDGNLWFTEVTGDKVGRITPTGQITEFAAPAAGAITTGPDGAIWFTAGNSGVGKITTSGSVTTFATPGGAS